VLSLTVATYSYCKAGDARAAVKSPLRRRKPVTPVIWMPVCQAFGDQPLEGRMFTVCAAQSCRAKTTGEFAAEASGRKQETGR
jgi:hypothetical protein